MKSLLLAPLNSMTRECKHINSSKMKEEFLSWLKSRVKHYGYEENIAPDYYFIQKL